MIDMESYHRGFFPISGKEGEIMRLEQNQPYKVYLVGGRTFPVYLEYNEQFEESYPAYPDFEENPEYTAEGRPFAMSAQESCPDCKPRAPERTPPGDCGGCGWFHREQTPYDPIGVCMCDARRRKNETNKDEIE
jgi:hypothetical protein